MPSEFRDIVFTNDEVAEALGAYDRLQPDQKFGCAASDLWVAGNNGLELTMCIKDPAGDRRMSVTPEMLRSALVRYCIENNIMVPRRAKKTMFLGKKTATLRIKIE